MLPSDISETVRVPFDTGTLPAISVAGGGGDLRYSMALALSTAYELVGVGVSLLVFQRRDITA